MSVVSQGKRIFACMLNRNSEHNICSGSDILRFAHPKGLSRRAKARDSFITGDEFRQQTAVRASNIPCRIINILVRYASYAVHSVHQPQTNRSVYLF